MYNIENMTFEQLVELTVAAEAAKAKLSSMVTDENAGETTTMTIDGKEYNVIKVAGKPAEKVASGVDGSALIKAAENNDDIALVLGTVENKFKYTITATGSEGSDLYKKVKDEKGVTVSIDGGKKKVIDALDALGVTPTTNPDLFTYTNKKAVAPSVVVVPVEDETDDK